MKILVCAKQVPDPDVRVKLNAQGTDIVKDGIKTVVNPFDEIANEEALRLTEKNGGEVVVLGIGPKDIATQIRSCLAMGSARGLHVVTDAVLDSDAVARLIVKVVEREAPDLVLMGKQAVDDDAGQAAQIVATLLGWPQALYACKVEANGATLTVAREVDGGIETVAVDTPALISADLRLNEPRYASLPNIMKAKKKPLDELTPESLGVVIAPKVKLVALTAPAARKAGARVKSVDELVDKLVNEAKIF